MADTTTEIETEIEARRVGVEQTIDRLKGRLSFDQVVDDLGNFLGMDNAPDLLRAAGQKMRDRPVALGLIGAGLLWLAMAPAGDERSTSSNQAQGRQPKREKARYRSDFSRQEGEQGSAPGVVAGAATAISDRAHEAADKVKSIARDTTSMVRDAGEPIAAELNSHPLLFGAGAVAVGALIGSALPMTEGEEKLLAPRRKALMSEARSMSRDLGDQAARVAKATYGTAVKSARREGLVPDVGTSLSEKIERVADDALEEAKTQLASSNTDGDRQEDAVTSAKI